MNLLNRLVAIIVFLLILALAIGTIGIVSGLLAVSTVDSVHTYPPLHQVLSDLAHLQPMNAQGIVVAAAGLTGLLMLVLLALDLRPPRAERTLMLAHDGAGEVTIAYDTLRKVAEQASMDVERVDAVRCRVGMRNGALRVRCQATADPFADASVVGHQVESVIRERLQQTLGMPVDHVAVRVELKKPGTRVRVR